MIEGRFEVLLQSDADVHRRPTAKTSNRTCNRDGMKIDREGPTLEAEQFGKSSEAKRIMEITPAMNAGLLELGFSKHK